MEVINVYQRSGNHTLLSFHGKVKETILAEIEEKTKVISHIILVQKI